jgi:ABC-2 type transport system permease protein
MPEPLRLFADNQPFTPIIETLRGLLLGTPIGNSGLIAVAWCVAITILAFVWALRLYEGNPAKP